MAANRIRHKLCARWAPVRRVLTGAHGSTSPRHTQQLVEDKTRETREGGGVVCDGALIVPDNLSGNLCTLAVFQGFDLSSAGCDEAS